MQYLLNWVHALIQPIKHAVCLTEVQIQQFPTGKSDAKLTNVGNVERVGFPRERRFPLIVQKHAVSLTGDSE